MSPLRIGLVAEDYYPQLGGVPEHVHHLARELDKLGHNATIVTSHMRNEGADPAYVRRVGTSIVIYANGGVARLTVGWRLTARLAALFRAERFDVVHVHGGLSPTLGIVAPWAAFRAGIPVVDVPHLVPAFGGLSRLASSIAAHPRSSCRDNCRQLRSTRRDVALFHGAVGNYSQWR